MTRDKLLRLQALASEISSIVAVELGTAQTPEQPPAQTGGFWDRPAPYGRNPVTGEPKEAPAFEGAKRFWQAAEQQGHFKYTGVYAPGIQTMADGTPPPDLQHEGDWAHFEDAVDALAQSSWGRAWLEVDENAKMLSAPYQRKWNGYIVKAKSNNPDDGLVRVF